MEKYPVKYSSKKIQAKELKQPVELEFINLHSQDLSSKQLDDSTYKPVFTLQPRISPVAYKIFKTDRVLWSFETSIFKNYKLESEDLIRKCFEIDFQHTKI